MRGGDLDPSAARELLLRSTGLIGNCQRELLEAEMDFNRVLADAMEKNEAAARATIAARNTEAYRRMAEAKFTTALCSRHVSTLRSWLRSFEEEMRLAR